MEDFVERIISKMPKGQATLKILEMGAGTGGTTVGMAKLLAKLNVPVECTFTDLSPSLVAAAARRFKEYQFLKFQTFDIENTPPVDLVQSQHIVIANNCVHATRSPYNSTRNIHSVLRPDGFLMILEMTETLYWCDLVFGLLEGWWLFEDDRQHVVAHQTFWEQKMLDAGYGYVDWTEGHRPEASLQRIVIALASNLRYERNPVPLMQVPSTDLAARQAVVDEYVRTYSGGLNELDVVSGAVTPDEICVLVTGATGSLGSHLVAHFASLPGVKAVVCLNRRNRALPALARQQKAIKSKGIEMNDDSWSKLKVFETDTTKLLGLSKNEYGSLLESVTHIVHNAWPMSINQPLKAFEPQFRVMRNLIQLAKDVSTARSPQHKISFQFISSTATVGLYPVWTGHPFVPEERMTIESILPSGYSDAKFICEKMLDKTLHRWGRGFRTMAVRIGQIAGSKTSGYWNSIEHLAFLLKSPQTLKCLPGLEGVRCYFYPFSVCSTNALNRNYHSALLTTLQLPFLISSSRSTHHIQYTISRTQNASLGDT